MADLTKNLVLGPFGCLKSSSTHSFLTADQLLTLGLVPTNLTDHFDTQYQPQGVNRAVFVAELTKNLDFRPVGCARGSSTPSIGLLSNF